MEVGLPIAAVLLAVAVVVAVAIGGIDVDAAFGERPLELVMSRHIGWEVDRTTRGKICVVSSKDECLSRRPSSQPGGFEYPSSVATNTQTGDLYVADLDNYRVQEFTATGTFLRMFGWDVNGTKDGQAGAARPEKNVCTAASGDLCRAGVSGTAAGQLAYATSVAVDPIGGDVYVVDTSSGDARVDKYTAGGRFVWMVGKDVNETTKGNICDAREVEASKAKCKAGVEVANGSLEPAAFKFLPQEGNLLAVGGPEDLLYVGDEHRVQEFDTEGKWKREILLTSISSQQASGVAALAVDKGGDLYLVYSVPSLETGPHVEPVAIVREFNHNGEQVASFPVNPRQSSASVQIQGMAIDSAGLVAVIGVEIGPTFHQRFGSLYTGAGRLVGEFTPPADNDGITFNSEGDLYVAATDDHEVVAYVPAPLMELVTSPIACEIGINHNPAVAFNCALNV
jgi:hypothetical protein